MVAAQLNLFYRYLFDSSWEISLWVGWRSPRDSTAIGATWYAPINDYWAGFTGGYYAFEGDTWNMYTGLMRHWGNRARKDYLGQDRHMPYLPVADNTSMTGRKAHRSWRGLRTHWSNMVAVESHNRGFIGLTSVTKRFDFDVV